MSMIEKKIKYLEWERRLSFLTFANTGDEKLDEAYVYFTNLLDEAIDTIKSLSEKLSSSNLDGVWHIVADGDLPNDDDRLLYTYFDKLEEQNRVSAARGWWVNEHKEGVIAWMFLPDPYKGK